MKMIDKLRLLALKFQCLKPLTIVLALVSMSLFVYILIGTSGLAKDDYFLMPSVMVLLWSLLGCLFLYTFPFVPEKPTKEAGLLNKIIIYLKRFYYYLFAIFLFGATLAILLLSFKILSVWVQDYS